MVRRDDDAVCDPSDCGVPHVAFPGLVGGVFGQIFNISGWWGGTAQLRLAIRLKYH